MKIAYISCFTAPEPSLSEYSLRFADILEQVEEVVLVKLDLSTWHMRSGNKMYREVKQRLQDFIELEGEFEYFYFELLTHHLMVWSAILAKNELGIEGKVFVTMHDPPLPVNGALGVRLPSGKFYHRLARIADLFFPKYIFRKLEILVDGIFFLTEAGEKSFLKQWPAMKIKTTVIPHLPFTISDEVICDLSQNGKNEKSPNRRYELFFAGLWWKHKGIEQMFGALSQLAHEGMLIRLVISGSGPAKFITKVDLLLTELVNTGVEVEKPGHLGMEELYSRGNQADCWVVPYQTTNKVSASGILVRGLTIQAQMIISELPQLRETANYFESDILSFQATDVMSLKESIKSSMHQASSRKPFDINKYNHIKTKSEKDILKAVDEMLKAEHYKK